eukprot:753875-Hanusia_phi.AAC.7
MVGRELLRRLEAYGQRIENLEQANAEVADLRKDNAELKQSLAEKSEEITGNPPHLLAQVAGSPGG